MILLKKLIRTILLASGVAIFSTQAGYSAVVWDDAIALYRFENNLEDSNGDNDGVGKQSSVSGAVTPEFVSLEHQEKPGWTDTAVRLESKQFIDLGQGAENAFQITGSLTLFARVYVESPGAVMALLSKDGANGKRAYAMRLDNTNSGAGTLVARFNGNFIIDYTSPDLKAGVWLDLVAVYEAGSRVELYINGESVKRIVSGVPMSLTNNSDTPLLLGASPFPNPASNPPDIGNTAFSGLYESAAIWNRALGEEEVRSLSVIPEPGTWGLLGVGAASFALARRKMIFRGWSGGVALGKKE